MNFPSTVGTDAVAQAYMCQTSNDVSAADTTPRREFSSGKPLAYRWPLVGWAVAGRHVGIAGELSQDALSALEYGFNIAELPTPCIQQLCAILAGARARIVGIYAGLAAIENCLLDLTRLACWTS